MPFASFDLLVRVDALAGLGHVRRGLHALRVDHGRVSRNRPLSLSSSQVITKRTPADYAEALVLTLEGQR
jgi:hypothetical protein